MRVSFAGNLAKSPTPSQVTLGSVKIAIDECGKRERVKREKKKKACEGGWMQNNFVN